MKTDLFLFCPSLVNLVNVLMNSIVNKNNRTALSIASGERDGSIDLEMAGT